jgi:MFS family permease
MANRKGVGVSLPPIRLLVPLRQRDYRLLALGALVSLLGDGLFLVALPLQVYELRNIPTALSAVGLVWAASQVATLLVGGWASDHFERRRIMLAADLARAAAIGGIGLLAVIGALELWHVLVLGAVFGAGNGFFNPASTAIVPDLLDPEDLPQANAFLGVARPSMMRLLGPALGGFLVAAYGPGWVLLIDAASFCVSAFLLALIRPPGAPAAREPAGLRENLGDVIEGFMYVRRHPWCWAWLLGSALSLLAFTGPLEIVLPYLLLNDPLLGLSEEEAAVRLGTILAVGGLGSVGVAVTIGQLSLPRRFVTAMYLAEGTGVAMLVVYGVMGSLWQALLASLVMNGMFSFTDIAWTTLLQRRVPRSLLGRVSSLDWLTSLGLIPLSFAIAGPLATRFGPRPVLIAGGLVGSATLFALRFIPGVDLPDQEQVRPEVVQAVAGRADQAFEESA